MVLKCMLLLQMKAVSGRDRGETTRQKCLLVGLRLEKQQLWGTLIGVILVVGGGKLMVQD